MKRYLNSGCLIAVIGTWLAISTGALLIVALVGARPNTRAVLLMATGLVLLWVVLAGITMRWLREPLRLVLQAINVDWRIKFVLLATFLALIEELISTAMTNLSPLFGVPVGAAFITASGNYFDVVCLHSVVVFVPMFVGWAFLLQYYDFSPNAVFLLFGLTGVVAEAMYGGGQAVVEFGLWVFVYGLMVYLPAYTLPAGRGAKPPRWWHYGAAVLLPLIFAIPVATVVSIVHPYRTHFPPIAPGT